MQFSFASVCFASVCIFLHSRKRAACTRAVRAARTCADWDADINGRLTKTQQKAAALSALRGGVQARAPGLWDSLCALQRRLLACLRRCPAGPASLARCGKSSRGARRGARAGAGSRHAGAAAHARRDPGAARRGASGGRGIRVARTFTPRCPLPGGARTARHGGGQHQPGDHPILDARTAAARGARDPQARPSGGREARRERARRLLSPDRHAPLEVHIRRRRVHHGRDVASGDHVLAAARLWLRRAADAAGRCRGCRGRACARRCARAEQHVDVSHRHRGGPERQHAQDRHACARSTLPAPRAPTRCG